MKKTIPILLAFLCSCASSQVPRSDITFDLVKGTGHLLLPKDADVSGLLITVSTNHDVSIKIQKLSVKTNPEVIGASGVATADSITAIGNVVIKGVETGMTSGLGSIAK